MDDNMKKSQLEELIRHITCTILKEYTSMVTNPTSDSKSKDASLQQQDPSAPSPDAMTDSERKRLEREAEKERLEAIRRTKLELKSTEAQDIYFNRQELENKSKIKAKRKQLQNLKKQISSGGAGAISGI